jgi:probable O-glycosylation ligase (exosortase A-associated)
MSLRGILLLLFFIPSIPLAFLRPFYGVILWTIVAFTSPQWYTWGAATLIPWAVLIAVATIGGFCVYMGKNWGRMFSRESGIIAILWVWFGITTIVSVNNPLFAHHAEDTWAHINLVSKIFLMVFITIGIVDSFARLRTLVITIASCFGIFVVKSLPWLLHTGGSDRIYGPERSMIADNNDFGLALNMTLPMFLFLAQSESKPWMKRLWTALFVMTIPCIFFTYSRGALVGLVVVLGFMILRIKQRLLLVPVAVLGFAGATLFAPQTWKDRMNPSADNMLDKSAQGRINAWKFSIRLIEDYPITGGGFGTFTAPLFLLYAPDPLDAHGAHSVYFGILGEHGIPGLLLFLSLIAASFHSIHQVVKWARLQGDEVAICYANMFRFSLVGFLTSGLFLGRAYFDYFYTIIACIVILKKVCLESWSAPQTQDGYATPEEQIA